MKAPMPYRAQQDYADQTDEQDPTLNPDRANANDNGSSTPPGPQPYKTPQDQAASAPEIATDTGGGQKPTFAQLQDAGEARPPMPEPSVTAPIPVGMPTETAAIAPYKPQTNQAPALPMDASTAGGAQGQVAPTPTPYTAPVAPVQPIASPIPNAQAPQPLPNVPGAPADWTPGNLLSVENGTTRYQNGQISGGSLMDQFAASQKYAEAQAAERAKQKDDERIAAEAQKAMFTTKADGGNAFGDYVGTLTPEQRTRLGVQEESVTPAQRTQSGIPQLPTTPAPVAPTAAPPVVAPAPTAPAKTAQQNADERRALAAQSQVDVQAQRSAALDAEDKAKQAKALATQQAQMEGAASPYTPPTPAAAPAPAQPGTESATPVPYQPKVNVEQPAVPGAPDVPRETQDPAQSGSAGVAKGQLGGGQGDASDVLSQLLSGVSGQGAGSAVADATQKKILDQLANPNAYGSDAVKSAYDWMGGNIDDQYKLQQQDLEEEMARRGLSTSTIGAGRMADLNVGKRSAKATLAQDLGQKMAESQQSATGQAISQGTTGATAAQNDQQSWLSQLMGYGQQGFENDVTTNKANADENSQWQDFLMQMLNAGYGG